MNLNEKYMKGYFARFVLVLLVSISLPAIMHAQEPPSVIRSTDKVMIDGNIYYIHIVKQGETLYSISKAYNVSQKVISEENPMTMLGLRPEMALKIPVIAETEKIEEKRDYKNYDYHQVRGGETLYAISRRYEVEVDEILESNPWIKIGELPVGGEIRIPKKKIIARQEQFSQTQDDFIYHWVRPQETLYSISREYDLSIRKIRKANNGLRDGLKQGMVIRIPSGLQRETTIVDEKPVGIPERIGEIEETLRFEATRPCDTGGFRRGPSKVDVALLLPFYLENNDERFYIDSSKYDDNGKRIYNRINRPGTWIYPRSYSFLEFYEGALLAIDSITDLGMEVDLHVFDTERDSSRVAEIILSDDLEGMDLIIGPVFTSFPSNVQQVAEYGRKERIPVVSPLSANREILRFNPNLYQVKPSIYTEIQMAAEHLGMYYDRNIVLIHAGDSLEVSDIDYLKRNLFYQFSYYTYIDEVIFKEVIFDKNMPQIDTINIIEQAFLPEKENIVVVFSSDEPFISKIISNLNVISGNYELKVFGFSSMHAIENIELEYYYNINLNIFINQHIDYNNPEVRNFLRKYRRSYRTEPTQFSFAWEGYDIMYYFLSAIKKYGRDFSNCLPSHKERLIHTDMEFRRNYFYDGFENKSIWMLSFIKENDYVRLVTNPTERSPGGALLDSDEH